MPSTPRLYEKLSSPRVAIAVRLSLWLASDHLMLVRSTGYTEQYQRIQLRDIQAFLVGVSHRRRNWMIAWAVLAVAALIPLTVDVMRHEKPEPSGVNLLFALAFLVFNHLLGPTCRVTVVTRVQTIRLPFVRRRKADKILARLRPLIEAAQADLLTRADVVRTGPPPLA